MWTSFVNAPIQSTVTAVQVGKIYCDAPRKCCRNTGRRATTSIRLVDSIGRPIAFLLTSGEVVQILADQEKKSEQASGAAMTPEVARLMEAENQADEMVGRAKEQAVMIIAEAKERAQQIRDTSGATRAGDEVAETTQDKCQREKRVIEERGARRIESIRLAGEARLAEAVARTLAFLFGES